MKAQIVLLAMMLGLAWSLNRVPLYKMKTARATLEVKLNKTYRSIDAKVSSHQSSP